MNNKLLNPRLRLRVTHGASVDAGNCRAGESKMSTWIDCDIKTAIDKVQRFRDMEENP